MQGAQGSWFGKGGAKVKAKPRARGGKKASKQLDMPQDDDVAFSSKALAKV